MRATRVGVLVAALVSSLVLLPASSQAADRPGSSMFDPVWAGYVNTTAPKDKPVSTEVVLPSLRCTGPSRVALWVGFDGYPAGNDDVEQDGVSAICDARGDQPTYQLWWELYDEAEVGGILRIFGNPFQRNVNGYHPAAGDTLEVLVSHHRSGLLLLTFDVYFSIEVVSPSGRKLYSWSATKQQPFLDFPMYSSSECILEDQDDASEPLIDFAPARFRDCSAIAAAPRASDLVQLGIEQFGEVDARTGPISAGDAFVVSRT
jgi:hypothetical protein